MLGIKPIPEDKAEGKTKEIYIEILKTFNLYTVPLIFQYIASFPQYFNYIWQQIYNNHTDPYFQNLTNEISFFAREAMNQIYQPNALTKLFLVKVKDRPEEFELNKFVTNNIKVYSSFYLVSLAIRESMKGKYLGLKQIGEHLSEVENRSFNNLSEGFTGRENLNSNKSSFLDKKSRDISIPNSSSLANSYYNEFFQVMDREMKDLLKREDYLTRRVELERFSLSKLHLLPHPLESSIATITRQTSSEKNFPELIYLLSELFPTQNPYKLLASSVMEKALRYKVE